MLSETQLTEIRNYLLSKKLPIDILIEVNDHFISQITDLQREENLSFEEAFEKTKENWKEEFKTTVPFYVIANKDKRAITNFEKKLKNQNDREIIKTSVFIIILMIFVYLSSLFKFNFATFKYVHKSLLIASYIITISIVFFNLIQNRFMYNEKYKEYKFSVYQWRTTGVFSFSYLILLYLKPIESIFQKILVYDFSFEVILKLLLFFSFYTIMLYTGIYHLKLINTVKKVKPFLKYL